MKIGLAQMDIYWEDIEKNKGKVLEFMERAKEQNVELLIFPEMTLTGFSMNTKSFGGKWKEEIEFFKRISTDYGMTIVAGYTIPVLDDQSIYRENHKQYNCLGVFEDGDIKMEYKKIHPFSYGGETEYFESGTEIKTMEWRGMTMGAFICYDLRFPEIFQLSSKNSEIIFVIANWPSARIEHWDCLLQARAIENQSFIVGVNRSGMGGGLEYNGHSAVYSPLGKKMTPNLEKEGLLTTEIDREAAVKYRKEFPVKRDRKQWY